MLNHLNNHFNETSTENGALAYNSTGSSVLDLFAMGGAFRNRSDEDIQTLVSKAFSENKLLTMKTLFYLRDILGGQGERRFFKVALQHIAIHSEDSLRKNLHLIPEFGRWDDLWVLLDTNLKNDVLRLVLKQLKEDINSDNPSLLAKWLPSENASSHTTKRYARMIIKHYGITPKQYRKRVVDLRNRISLVETKLTEKNYNDINYSKLPSKAGMKYREAFYRNDEKRYTSFLDSLSKGETKINAGTLLPNDIVGKILSKRLYSWGGSEIKVTPQDVKLFEGMWENLTDYIGDNQEDSLVMADVSGSMSGTPLNVAISLAMYIAERNKGAYKDHFMTFSSIPELVKIKGENIVKKVENISNESWGMSTNIEKALITILNVAISNKLPNHEVVKKLYIISDMQFDQCTEGANANIFKQVEHKFKEHGYDMPSIVFWNVDARNSNLPMTMNELGVQLVSGFSPSIMTQLLGGDSKTPYEFMLEVIDSARYARVTA